MTLHEIWHSGGYPVVWSNTRSGWSTRPSDPLRTREPRTATQTATAFFAASSHLNAFPSRTAITPSRQGSVA